MTKVETKGANMVAVIMGSSASSDCTVECARRTAAWLSRVSNNSQRTKDWLAIMQEQRRYKTLAAVSCQSNISIEEGLAQWSKVT